MSVQALNRKEAIASGEDIAPVTREEYYLKGLAEGQGGGGATIANVTIRDVSGDSRYILIEGAFANDDGASYYCDGEFAEKTVKVFLSNGVSYLHGRLSPTATKTTFVEEGSTGGVTVQSQTEATITGDCLLIVSGTMPL